MMKITLNDGTVIYGTREELDPWLPSHHAHPEFYIEPVVVPNVVTLPLVSLGDD